MPICRLLMVPKLLIICGSQKPSVYEPMTTQKFAVIAMIYWTRRSDARQERVGHFATAALLASLAPCRSAGCSWCRSS
jgi:hypothetical protein